MIQSVRKAKKRRSGCTRLYKVLEFSSGQMDRHPSPDLTMSCSNTPCPMNPRDGMKKLLVLTWL